MSPPVDGSNGLVVQPWSAGDVRELASLQAPSRWLRSESEWGWALRNPAGSRLYVARREGRIAALYAGLAVRTRVLGETRGFTQVLEAGTGPSGAERDAWLAAARAFHEAYLGAQADLVLYGWSTLGRAHLEFERLRVQSLLARAPGPGPSVLPEGVRTLERFGAEADELYACCATHWNASAIRDAAFLNWRFADNPRHRYRLLAVQSGATLRGYAVQRLGHELGPRLSLLLDWLVLPGDDPAADSLLQAALAGARAEGAEALAASFPEWSPWSPWFQERGFLHHPSEHVQVVLGAVPRFDMLWLRDNWWTTLCDALEL